MIRKNAGDIILATCIDHNVIQQAMVAATSIAWHSTSPRRIVFHIFYASPRTAQSEELAAFRRGNVSVELHYIECTWPDGVHYPGIVYQRLSLPDMMPDTDRVIYLDVDLVVQSDIAALFDLPLQGKAVGAVIDLSMQYARLDPRPLKSRRFTGTIADYFPAALPNVDPDRYVNAGVVVMDLMKLRALGYSTRARKLVMGRGRHFLFSDQDVLNTLLAGKIRIVDGRWNMFAHEMVRTDFSGASDALAARTRRDRRRPSIVHFASTKPWAKFATPTSRLWWKYADLSPWAAQIRTTFADSHTANFIPRRPRWARYSGPVTALRHWVGRAARLVGRKG